MSEKLGDLYRKRMMDAPERPEARDEDDGLTEKQSLGSLFRKRINAKGRPAVNPEANRRSAETNAVRSTFIGTRG